MYDAYDADTKMSVKKKEKKKKELDYVSNICIDLKKRPGIKKHIESISLVEVDKSNNTFRFTKQQLNP